MTKPFFDFKPDVLKITGRNVKMVSITLYLILRASRVLYFKPGALNIRENDVSTFLSVIPIVPEKKNFVTPNEDGV